MPMKNKQIPQILEMFTTLLMFVSPGCAATQLYEGSRLAKKDVAVILRSTADPVIVAIDEHPVATKSYHFEVLPGEHCITMSESISHGGHDVLKGEATLAFLAEAGRTYHIHAAFGQGGQLVGWI